MKINVNPFLLKELRQFARNRMISTGLLLFLLLEVLVIWQAPVLGDGLGPGTGNVALGFCGLVFAFATAVLLPWAVLIRFVRERRVGTKSDLVLATPLSARCVIDGKLLSAELMIALFASTLLPFIAVAHALHGVDTLGMVQTGAMVVGMALMSLHVAVALGAVRSSSVTRYGLFIMFMLPLLLTGTIFTSARSDDWVTSEGEIGTFLCVIASICALLRAGAIWLLAPEASERSMRLRLTALAVAVGWMTWMLFFNGAGLSSGNGLRATEGVRGCSSVMVALFIVLQTCACSLPVGRSRRQRESRVPWLLSTGMVNGFVFAFLCALACAAVPWLLADKANATLDPLSQHRWTQGYVLLLPAVVCTWGAVLLFMRALWRWLLVRWGASPVLAPILGGGLLVILHTLAAYADAMASTSLSFIPLSLYDFEAEPVRHLVASALACAVAILINLPAALKR